MTSLQTCSFVLFTIILGVQSQPKPYSTTTAKQIERLKATGYDVDRIENNNQLRQFLYTWLNMESSEKG